MKSNPSGITRSPGATTGGRLGVTVSGAGAAASRLRTITQRTYSSTGSSIWFRPRVRTQTTPDVPFEFCFSPITCDSDRSVSPGQTGASQRPWA